MIMSFLPNTTYEEIRKLLDTDKVDNTWTTSANGVTGRQFTDKASGNSIFLPAAGSRRGIDGTLNAAGSYGDYWSGRQYVSGQAYDLRFGSGYADWFNDYRSSGFSVRSVAEN